MAEYSISLKVLFRIRRALNEINEKWAMYVDTKMSRDIAKRLRRDVISENGNKVVDRQLLTKIKVYSEDAFGSSSYWPWLAFYTELRGEFKKGWIPDDYYRFELLPNMNPETFMRFSEQKIIDHKLFGESIVEHLFFRTNGYYCGKDGIVKSKAEVQKILSEIDDELIIKPTDGKGGKHIVFKQSSELNLDELPENMDFIFQKVVKQHTELNKLYPHSINTFRVMTYINQEGVVEIKFIIIRFGQGGSRIDNASAGGGWIFVRPDGTVEPTAYDGNGIAIGSQHPDTGIKYSKLKLPFLPKVITLCENAHRSFPYTRIIGWDAFVSEQGEPKLIEWNANNPFFGTIEARFGPFYDGIVGKPESLVNNHIK